MKRKKAVTLTTAALALTMTVCGSSSAIAASELTAESKPATQYTIDANQEVYALLDFEDTEEFENATKGLIASPDTLDIYDENGKLVWSQTAYAFLDQDAPDTANPSLWRDTQLNHIYGLFEVTDGIYQVRGYDMSNITFIKYGMDCSRSTDEHGMCGSGFFPGRRESGHFSCKGSDLQPFPC
jgi:alkyl sulfatase BDS1-like metallo-beta-lactamase superfamily hydrolase